MLDRINSWIARFRTFTTEVTTELKKVTWPQKKEVSGTTVVVIVSVFFFGIYLYLVDLVFAHVIRFVQQRIS